MLYKCSVAMRILSSQILVPKYTILHEKESGYSSVKWLMPGLGQEKYQMNPEQLAVLHERMMRKDAGASLKEPTPATNPGMKVLENCNSLNKTEMHKSTVIAKKEESEGKAIPYRRKLTNKCSMSHGMRKIPI